MEFPNFVPTPEKGLELLMPVSQHLQPAYDNSVFESKNFLETRSFDCDTNSFLTLVRLHVKNFLVRAGIKGIKFEEGSLSPLSFRVNGAFFKSWKAATYELPRPGTGGRKRFINQQYLLALDYGKRETIKNFVILWNLSQSNKITLWLVCPKRYDEEQRVAEAWWHIQIDDPATTMTGETLIGSQPPDLPLGAVEIAQTGE